MINLALSQEEMQRRKAMQNMPRFQMAGMQAPAAQKGPIGQMTDMAKQKAMTAAVNKGAEMATTKGAEMMAGNAALSGIGTAMPYIGAGLLAGKAFGLFSKGGPVYAQEGQLLGPLALRKIRYKQDGGKVEIEATMGE